jgi:hypothetical protein
MVLKSGSHLMMISPCGLGLRAELQNEGKKSMIPTWQSLSTCCIFLLRRQDFPYFFFLFFPSDDPDCLRHVSYPTKRIL